MQENNMKASAKDKLLLAKWEGVPAGTDVVVRKDNGEELRTKTRSSAQMLGGHTPVIWVEGITGCYALDRVRKL
jgi:hypothetical protein